MLDMGFYDDIIQIVKKLPAERQTIMFSATMPSKIKKLAENILKEPAFVNIAVSKPAEGVWQVAYVCYETQKLGLIMSLFKEHKDNKVVVFSSSKSKVKEVTSALRRAGMKVGSMHSDLEQNERDEVMLDFKSGKLNILIATDIISRGIDIDDIEVVVNYDVPHDAEDYIHRIGRTARANREGVGVTFVSEKDQPKFKRIENFIGKDIHKLPLPAELGDAPEYSPKKAGNRPDGHRRKPGNRAGQRRGGDRSDARDKNVGRKAETLGTERTNGAESGDKPQNNRRKRWNKPRRKGNGGGAADVKQPQGE
jgi:superfamily II DNA/RNA helicase